MAIATATERRTRAPLLRGAVVVLVALAVAAKLLALGLGDQAVRTRAPMLVGPASAFSPGAAVVAAELRFAAGDFAGAEALVRRALQEAPLSAAGLRILGLSLEARGEGQRAAEAIALAGGLGWRDTPTQLWLMDAYARQGDYAAALERADALARRRQLLSEMMAVMTAAAVEPQARAALARRLSADPPWRRLFFEAAHRLPPEHHDAYTDFLAQLVRGGGRLAPSEVEPIVANLFQRGDHGAARALWARFAAPPAAEASLLFDGGFDAATLKTDRHIAPFEWRFRQAPGSETELRPGPGQEGPALYAASAGNARYDIARQGLVLPPGRYLLSVDAAAEPGTRLEGFSWLVECLPDLRALETTRSSAPAADGWTRLSYAFAVPAAGCPAQRLRLVLHGMQTRPLELWFDDVALRRAG